MSSAASATHAHSAGQMIYAVGDVHGRYDLLVELLALIRNDWRSIDPQRRPILIFCGDYIDRGADSRAVLEALLWLDRRDDLTLALLKGNHEQALLAFIDDPIEGAAWLDHGGRATLSSYGVVAPRLDDGGAAYRRARDQLLEQMPAAHLHLLQRLEMMAVIGDYAFVHAGVNGERPLDQQREQDMLWIRNGFVDVARCYEKIIVHGHSWTSDRVELHDHRIGIDTGGYETGILSAVRVTDDGVAILQTASSR